MFRFFNFFIILAFQVSALNAQNQSTIDSLQNLLADQNHPTLQRAQILEELSRSYYDNNQITLAIQSLKQSNRIRSTTNEKRQLIDNLLQISSYYNELDNSPMAIAYLRLYSLEIQQFEQGILLKRISDLERLQNLEVTALEQQRDQAIAENQDLHTRLNYWQVALVSILFFFLVGTSVVFIYLYRKKPATVPLTERNPEIELKINSLQREVDDLKNYLNSGSYLARKYDSLNGSVESKLKKVFPELVFFSKARTDPGSNFCWFTTGGKHAVLCIGQTNISGLNGSLIAMLAKKILHHIVIEELIITPSMALTMMDQKLRQYIGNESEFLFVGCGFAYCLLNLDSLELEFAGAGLPLYLIQNRESKVLKGNTTPLANSFAQEKFFETQTYSLKSGDSIFLSTQGFLDQIGQQEDKRFGRKSFQKLLSSLEGKKPSDQYFILEKVFREWKGMKPQTDDVLVLGIKV